LCFEKVALIGNSNKKGSVKVKFFSAMLIEICDTCKKKIDEESDSENKQAGKLLGWETFIHHLDTALRVILPKQKKHLHQAMLLTWFT